MKSLIFQSEKVSKPLQKFRQWWKKYLRIFLRFKKFQKCPLPYAQCWDRHAFLPQVPTSTTFSTLKVGGGGFFSKYFFQGCRFISTELDSDPEPNSEAETKSVTELMAKLEYSSNSE